MPDDPDDFTLEAQDARTQRRVSGRELGRQARVARRNAAEPEGLGFGAVEYDVPGLEGGGRQAGLTFGAPSSGSDAYKGDTVATIPAVMADLEAGADISAIRTTGGKRPTWRYTVRQADGAYPLHASVFQRMQRDGMIERKSQGDTGGANAESVETWGASAGATPAPKPPADPSPPVDTSPAEQLRVHLTEVTRDRFGRFVRLARLRECDVTGCSVDDPPPDVSGMLDQHLAFLESIRDTLEVAGPGEARELAEVVDAYRLELEDKREAITGQASADAFALAEKASRESYFVRGALEEALDVEGLDGRSRSRLALLLASWNKGHRAPFIRKRPDGGARVLARGPWSVDLAHPFIQSSGVADAAREGMREDPDLWEIEEPGAGPADDEFAAEAQARGEASVRGEL